MEKNHRRKNRSLTELLLLGFTLVGIGLILMDTLQNLSALGG